MTGTAPEMGGYQAHSENYPMLRLINGGMSELEMARAYTGGLEATVARDGETSLADVSNRMSGLGLPFDGNLRAHATIDQGLHGLDASIKEEVRIKKAVAAPKTAGVSPKQTVRQPNILPTPKPYDSPT